jgi:peptidoglycan/LPS O-acetylase OafA/YrhL
MPRGPGIEGRPLAEITAPARSPHRFEALDSWRGVCACAVVLFHLNAATHFHHWLNNGYVAVDFFFVLSGFVIASAYQARIEGWIDLARFTVRRLGRLYPLHLLVLGAYVLLELNRGFHHPAQFLTGERSLPALAADLLLVQGFSGYNLSWNMTAWSISVELWVNLAFALLAMWVGRRMPWAAAAIAGGLALLVGWPDLRLGPIPAAESDILMTGFACVMDFFLGVVALNLHRLACARRVRPPGWLEWPAVALALAAFAFAGSVSTLELSAVFFMVVLVFAFEAGPVSQALKHKAPLALGTASYSIYLTHSLYTLAAYHLVGWAGRSLGRTWVTWTDERDLLVLGGPWAMDLVAAGCLAAVIASSLVTYRYVEDPARIAFNRLSNRIQGRRPSEVPHLT